MDDRDMEHEGHGDHALEHPEPFAPGVSEIFSDPGEDTEELETLLVESDNTVPVEGDLSATVDEHIAADMLLEEEIYESGSEDHFGVGDRVSWDGFSAEIVSAFPRGWYRARDDQDCEYLLREDPQHAYMALPAHRLLNRPTYAADRGLAFPWVEGTVLRGSMPFGAVLDVVIALAQYVFALERQGFALIDLDPEGLIETADQGLKLRFPPRMVRLGEIPPLLDREGYTAPEIQLSQPCSGKEGVYTLGAFFYQLLTGLSPIQPVLSSVRIPGVPQVLVSALTLPENRHTPLQFLEALRDLQPKSTPRFDIGHATTVGLNPERMMNEDSYGFAFGAQGGLSYASDLRAVVCDGMGGMSAGEVASQAAVDAFLSHWNVPRSFDDLEKCVWDCNKAVLDALSGEEGGCTLTGVALSGFHYILGHVGDSRAYLGSGDALSQLSQDHSLVAAMVANGLMTEEEASVSADKNKILRSLGSLKHHQKDYVQLLEGDLQPEAALILVSDGVWGEISKDTLGSLWKAHALNPQALADGLVAAALEGGGMDNATAVVILRKT